MASFFRAINSKIRANPTLNYVFSTHFFGPVSNFGIPLAAVLDTQKSPELISGQMTAALIVYSATFMRYATAVTPWNPLLFAVHFVNEGAQLTQGYRWLQYHHLGGREGLAKAENAAKANVADAGEVKRSVQGLVDQAKAKAGK